MTTSRDTSERPADGDEKARYEAWLAWLHDAARRGDTLHELVEAEFQELQRGRAAQQQQIAREED